MSGQSVPVEDCGRWRLRFPRSRSHSSMDAPGGMGRRGWVMGRGWRSPLVHLLLLLADPVWSIRDVQGSLHPAAALPTSPANHLPGSATPPVLRTRLCCRPGPPRQVRACVRAGEWVGSAVPSLQARQGQACRLRCWLGPIGRGAVLCCVVRVIWLLAASPGSTLVLCPL